MLISNIFIFQKWVIFYDRAWHLVQYVKCYANLALADQGQVYIDIKAFLAYLCVLTLYATWLKLAGVLYGSDSQRVVLDHAVLG